MITEKSINLPASIKQVWSEIEDIEGIIRCMPGVEAVKAMSDRKWHIVIKGKVGFVSVTFDADMKITSWKPPSHLETTVDATARMGLGKAFQTQSLDLVQLSANETLAKYKADVALHGKIGSFGQRIIGGKVEELASGFIEAFIAKLNKSEKWKS